MPNRIKADGDVWRAVLDESDGRRSVVFFCTNGQRPYRVVAADDDLRTDADVAALSEDGLRALFDRSGSMNTSSP
ncbi:MAG: hypothetical protein ACE5FP_05200 [Gemmatimonadota bacterium]